MKNTYMQQCFIKSPKIIKTITKSDKIFDGLSLTQKLYMLDFRREANLENSLYSSVDLWKTTFAPYPRIPHDLKSEKKANDFILKNNVEIKQVHEITHMDGLIVFELLNILTSGMAGWG